ncbi:UDP-N-acetylmuramoyl-tripeptide--D-alanyl-D-alanine ligase [Ketobacter sp.]|uniref:UDP-N-acetylmuramoyl-tripeptide--D-alanyl-D- alanine ligase n=1 Tax=Ketobacter sp. TaxID=2083498 RepID=UPI000F2320B8|nr:UDP-N-acetylmuramoyl-tripeptide--D-alanyl-D-alanine ligase [Ketobacter sp.]RLU00428.1 MAG: UDP-N-acetylmuramoyl-tripeptide--D-alanyl-D-alanine ligase [Ketobacter sp.]
MQLSTLAHKIGGTLLGSDGEFARVSTDTRTLQAGDLFVALQGEHFDGHEYVATAKAGGAVAAMVSKSQAIDMPQISVADTRLGLGALSKAWLQQYTPVKIAITGSCGKTTVKEMLASILSQDGPTLSTLGNLNNDIGVPLTLCRLAPEHRYAVVEMGANHLGEIAYTAGLVEPDIALVNNVGSAHLEGFGSIENIAEAKSEIYQALPPAGVAVINRDDAFVEVFKAKTRHCRQVFFSRADESAEVYLESESMTATGQYHFNARVNGARITVQMSLIGRHNVANALAAIAVAQAAGCPLATITAGLNAVKAVPGRLRVVEELQQHKLIDDSYNANPDSMKSAIDVLAGLEGETCLVIGGMAELGESGNRLHREVGAYAARKGISTVYGVGESAALYREGFLSEPGSGVFITAENHQRLADDLFANQRNKTILVKGSRSAAMEKVIAHMLERQRAQGSDC